MSKIFFEKISEIEKSKAEKRTVNNKYTNIIIPIGFSVTYRF